MVSLTKYQAIQPNELENIFEALDQYMRIHEVAPLTLQIIGGAAITLGEYNPRTTDDVDVIDIEGYVEDKHQKGKETTNIEFPETFKQSIQDVAEEFNLMNNWLNHGSSFLHPLLPEGFRDRADHRKYGPRLSVKVSSRNDLIYLKTYAVINSLGTSIEPVHRQDLERLAPTATELTNAIDWSRGIYREINDEWNWDNQHLHESFKDLMQSLTGKRLPGKFFTDSESKGKE